jgi:hypothetical protein
MKNSFDIHSYLAEAEETFSGFNGDGEMMLSQSAATGRGMSAGSPTPYQIVVSNTTAGTLTARLFGRNQYWADANYGSDAGITVTPAQTNVTYPELLQQSANQPFDTSLIRVQSSNTNQVTQILTVRSKDSNGQECTIPVITQSYFSANQFQAGIVDVPYSVKLDGNTAISFPVLATTDVTITFFPSEKINIARNLAGASAAKRYGNPQVNIGQPQAMPSSYPVKRLF